MKSEGHWLMPLCFHPSFIADRCWHQKAFFAKFDIAVCANGNFNYTLVSDEFALSFADGGIAMTKGKINFTGSFGEYFIMTLGLLVLSVLTFGLLFPYAIWWQAKYFFTHLEIEMQN